MSVTIDDVFDAGSDILNSVSNAVESGNFSNLNLEIQRTMTGLGDKYKAGGVTTPFGTFSPLPRPDVPAKRSGSGGPQKSDYSSAAYGQPIDRNTYASDIYQTKRGGTKTVYVNTQGTAQSIGEKLRSAWQNRMTPFFQKSVERVGDILKIIFGAIGSFGFGITALVLCLALLLGTGFSSAIAITAIVFGVTAGLSGWLLGSGIRGKHLADRYYLYGRIIGMREYFSLEELARQAGKKLEEVRNDLHRMVQKGMLPQARFDAQETTLMLTDQAYQQYQDAENERLRREAESTRQTARADQAGVDREIIAILDEGERYLKTIRKCNDAIPDEAVSDKLFRLEEIMNRIFTQVRANPSSAGNLHRLMNYYLPTTTKLLYAYIDLDRQPEVGDNIIKTKREIEETLDTINDGFERLLDGLFADMAWDISSDISVMKNMMEQDGLTDGKNKIKMEV